MSRSPLEQRREEEETTDEQKPEAFQIMAMARECPHVASMRYARRTRRLRRKCNTWFGSDEKTGWGPLTGSPPPGPVTNNYGTLVTSFLTLFMVLMSSIDHVSQYVSPSMFPVATAVNPVAAGTVPVRPEGVKV